jgi:hypothetical protein
VLWTATGLTADPHTLPWKTLEDEAVSLLSRYIQIDTEPLYPNRHHQSARQ